MYTFTLLSTFVFCQYLLLLVYDIRHYILAIQICHIILYNMTTFASKMDTAIGFATLDVPVMISEWSL